MSITSFDKKRFEEAETVYLCTMTAGSGLSGVR